MLLSYIRVSTVDQNIDRQTIDADKEFVDKVSGSTTNRAKLEEMKEYAREGDTVTVHDISRLARNIKDLIELIELFNNKGVTVEFRKENLRFTPDKANPMNQLLLNLLGSVYQFEREMLLERQKEGIAKAKEKGKYKGRKSTVDYDLIKQLLEGGKSVRNTCKETGYSHGTVAKVSKKLNSNCRT